MAIGDKEAGVAILRGPVNASGFLGATVGVDGGFDFDALVSSALAFEVGDVRDGTV